MPLKNPVALAPPLNARERLAKIEFWLLIVLLLVLPTLEAPKNIVLVLYAGVSLWRRLSTPAPTQPWHVAEVAALALIGVSLVSTLANWPFANFGKGFTDTLKVFGLFLLIYRAGYTGAQHRALATAAAVGVLAGLAVGLGQWLLGWQHNLQFHSAGVVTQSAIFLGVAMPLTLGLAVAPQHRWHWVTALLLMSLALFFMGSRGAVVAVAVAMATVLLLLKNPRYWVMAVAFIAIAVSATLLTPDRLEQRRLYAKSTQFLAGDETPLADRERMNIWRVSASALKQMSLELALGIGPRNFHSIGTWPGVTGLDKLKMKLSHAHNLFLTKLIEEGVAGLAALLAFFIIIARCLYRDWRGGAWRQWSWFGGVGALIVPVVAGFFNTPFYQEHALLAAVLFAIYLAQRRASGPTTSHTS